MLLSILIPLTPVIIFLVFLFAPTGLILLLRNYQSRNKRSPLNFDMLRSPGETLREKIEDLTIDTIINLTFIPIIPLTCYSMVTTIYFLNHKAPSSFSIYFYFALCLLSTSYLLHKSIKSSKERSTLRLGYECELMVGQELNCLIKEGFNIYHDFPADGFNIDHIAIGPTGIFSLETKGRAKRKIIENKNWEVIFDGKKLIFPGWTEEKPIIQAIDQAKWLRKWLQKSTGAEYKVDPVLVIPGWYIKRTGPSDLKTYNGKNPIFLSKGKTVLFPEQIQAISYQIDQKCRTIAPKSYNNGDTGKTNEKN